MKINEIFTSIQGEGLRTGLPCTFVRLAGCNLRCEGWPCDTQYAQGKEGTFYSLEDLAQAIPSWPPYVAWTGGEPLIQREQVLMAMRRLDNLGYWQDLFTNGSIVIPAEMLAIDMLHIVMDLKLPSSGEYHRMQLENLSHLREIDIVKGVIADRADWDTYVRLTQPLHCVRVVTPVWDKLDAQELVKWMLEQQSGIRLGLQIHKYIWDPAARGV